MAFILSGEVVVAGRPEAGELLPRPAPQQQGAGVKHLAEAELVPRHRLLTVAEGPPAVGRALGSVGIVDDAVQGDELDDDDAAHGDLQVRRCRGHDERETPAGTAAMRSIALDGRQVQPRDDGQLALRPPPRVRLNAALTSRPLRPSAICTSAATSASARPEVHGLQRATTAWILGLALEPRAQRSHVALGHRLVGEQLAVAARQARGDEAQQAADQDRGHRVGRRPSRSPGAGRARSTPAARRARRSCPRGRPSPPSGPGDSRSSSRTDCRRRAACMRSWRSATTRLSPSRTSAITRTATPTQKASSSGGCTSARMPSQIDTAPPTTNIPMAASSAQ